MGVHVTKYMNEMKKEDPEKFKRHFSQWSKTLDKAKVKTCEDLYKKVHAAIRSNPDRQKKAGNKKPVRKVVQKGYERIQENSKGSKWLRHFRITTDLRKQKVKDKFAAAMAANQ